MKERNIEYIIGSILLAFGIFMLFKSIRIYSIDFYRFGSISTGAILIGLLFILGIIMVIWYKPFMKYIAFGIVLLIVASIILGTRLHFTGSLVDLLLMLVPIVVGSGLFIRGAIVGRKTK